MDIYFQYLFGRAKILKYIFIENNNNGAWTKSCANRDTRTYLYPQEKLKKNTMFQSLFFVYMTQITVSIFIYKSKYRHHVRLIQNYCSREAKEMGKYYIDGKQFNTVKSARDHIRSVLSSVGICKSLKTKNQKVFERIAKYLERHEGAYRKGVIDQYGNNLIDDIQIQHNMKEDLELNMTKQDGTSQVISWCQCVNPKEKTHRQKLNIAMRQAITEQLNDFRKENPNPDNICANQKCKEDDLFDCQVDHQIRFKDLTEQFLKDHPEEQIKKFDECLKTNRKKFLKSDEKWQKQWEQFHKKKAKLRWLCMPCNLKRKKQFNEKDDY